MRGFDFDGGAFFICTEISPRCYTIQQVNDVDVALKEFTIRKSSQTSSSASPPSSSAKLSVSRPSPSADVVDHSSNAPLPMLPWWFTAECRQELMGVPPPTDDRAVTPDTRPPSSIETQPMSQEQLRQRLQRQLEYYFSRENLVNDRYLRCQMDADQYVPIKIVANFPKVIQLTTDLDLIVDVLKSSTQLQVDESGQKVRPMSRRCTIILREIPEDADENEVKAMFGDGCPPYQTLSYGLNKSWYVTFATEQDTQKAFFHLQTLGKTFNGNPVFARIKTGGAPIGADVHGFQALSYLNTHIPLTTNSGALRGHLIVHHRTDQSEHNRNTPSPSEIREGDKAAKDERKDFDLGQILAQHGYLPRATFRPLAPSLTLPQTAVVPQQTSFFTQPILHNSCDCTHCASSQFVRPHFCHYLRTEAANEVLNEGVVVAAAAAADQSFLLEESPFRGHYCDDGKKCCGESVEVNSDGILSDCFAESANVSWEVKENIRFFRKRKRSRAHSEPPLAYFPTQFAVGRNEFVLRQCAKEDNRSWDPDKLTAPMLPSPVPRITDVPRLNGMGVLSVKEGGVDKSSEKHCSVSASGAFAGFQRQESVEAYQIAVAANGVAKQRRMTLEIEEEEEDQWEQVNNRKIRRKPMDKQQQNRQFHNINCPRQTLAAGRTVTGEQQHSADDRQPLRLFGTRSFDSVQPRPFNDSANHLNCRRENGHFGPTKINKFSNSSNPNSITDFAKVIWNNESTGKLTIPIHQFTPKVPNRVVQPLLSLTSETFSSLNPVFQQQQRGPFCSGTRGGRRAAVETGRKYGARRGRTWTNELGRSITTASNLNGQPQQQMGFNGLNAQYEEGMAREMGQQGTTKRSNEREGNGRVTEGDTTRPSRTRTTEQRRQTINAQQNGTTFSQQQHFRRHSRETVDKDGKVQKCSLKKEAPNGAAREEVQEGQQKRNNGFNFEEGEFPALLSCAFSSNNIGPNDHHQQKEREPPDDPSNSVALPSVNLQKTPSALNCVSIGALSTTNPSQLQFSAVVAGHGRRRATIGTTTEGGRKATAEGTLTENSRGDGADALQQQRSGTIGAAEKSYAQMLKG